MALDNAQFMSELSIVDPPGTDPLSEGDDQIRTSKRTQLQSFPNVDAAVTKTAAEMNDMALQGFPNLFTVQQTVSGDIIIQVGAATQQFGLFFNSETAFRRWAIIREATNTSGDLIIQRRDTAGAVQSTPLVFSQNTGQVLGSSGTAAAPQYTFQSDSGIGMFRSSPGVIGLAVGGSSKLDLSSIFASWGVPQIVPNGLQSAPTYSFNTATTTGMYLASGGELSFTVAGIVQFFIRVGGQVNMQSLGTGPGGGLQSGDLYVKQSQAFAGTELVVGMQP